MKYLLLLVFLYVIWRLWRARNRRGLRGERSRSNPSAERMLVCEHCGVYFPEGEGTKFAGRAYCSVAHQHAAQSVTRND